MREQLLKLLGSREWICSLCGKSLEKEIEELKAYYSTQYGVKPLKKRKSINIDIDHITPRSKGGVNELYNYQITHSTCNNKKDNNLTTSSLGGSGVEGKQL